LLFPELALIELHNNFVASASISWLVTFDLLSPPQMSCDLAI